MRRAKAAIAVVIALALLVGLAIIAEAWARNEVESSIADGVSEWVPDPEVEVGGLVLPQLIGGTLSQVRVSSPEVVVDDVLISDVVATATDARIRGQRSVGQLVATGTIPTENVLRLIEARVNLPSGVELELRDGRIVAVASIFGAALEARVVPVAESRAISFSIESVDLGGIEVDADALPFDLAGLLGAGRVELDQLPPGVDLSELRVTPDGVDVTLEATDLQL